MSAGMVTWCDEGTKKKKMWSSGVKILQTRRPTTMHFFAAFLLKIKLSSLSIVSFLPFLFDCTRQMEIMEMKTCDFCLPSF